MKSVVPILFALSACSFSSKWNSTGFGSGGNGSSSSSGGTKMAAMPDLTGKTVAEADALLRDQGFTIVAAQEQTDDLCGETDDHVMVAQGAICKQRPVAGAQTAANALRLTYTIEHDRYEGGEQPTPWRRMPDLVGKKPPALARKLVRTRGVLHVGVARPEAPPPPTTSPGTPPPPPPPAKPDTYF